MSKFHPLYWHQGLFLQPQHLQVTDLRNIQEVYARCKLSTPHFWGVVSLDINESQLQQNILEVRSASVLYQDGALVCYPDNSILSSRSFVGFLPESGEPMTVYLGLKRLNERGNNVTEVSNEAEVRETKTRFVTVTNAKKHADYHGAGPAIPVMSVVYSPTLLWESELADVKDFDLMPIAQLFKSEKGIELSKSYIPPSLHIDSSSALKNKLMTIRDEMTLRTNQLEEYKTTVDRTGEDLGEKVIAYRLALQLMSTYTAHLYHITEIGKMHPCELYGILRQMVGGLSTMNENINFLGLMPSGDSLIVPYNHSDLEKCMSTIEKGILRLMDVVTTGGESIFHLEVDDKGLFYVHLSESAVSPSSNFYITLITAKENFEDTLLPSFIKQAKIASLPKVRQLVEYALPSLPVKHLRNQPEGTRRIPNSHFFIASKDSELWDDIRSRRSIAVNWDDAPQDLKIQIIVTA